MLKKTFELQCAACGKPFRSATATRKQCPNCNSSMWRWKPGDPLVNAPVHIIKNVIYNGVLDLIRNKTFIDIKSIYLALLESNSQLVGVNERRVARAIKLIIKEKVPGIVLYRKNNGHTWELWKKV